MLLIKLLGAPPTERRPRQGRLQTGCGNCFLTPRAADRVSVVHAWPVLGLAGKERDHVSGKRCSGLDLLGCDPGPGYAARDFKTRESVVAYGLSHRRDGVRAAPSSSPVVCRIVGAPPLCAPARMISGRTLWEEEVRVGSRASPSSSNYAFLPVVEGFGGSSFRTERGLLPPF